VDWLRPAWSCACSRLVRFSKCFETWLGWTSPTDHRAPRLVHEEIASEALI
jgi:hypothetical protein